MIDKTNRVFDKETSFRTLELVNSWIVAADNKSSILIAFIALLVGLSASTYSQVLDLLVNGSDTKITFMIFFGLLYLAILGFVIYHLIEVFIARTKKKNNSINLVSFVSISNLSVIDYIEKSKTVTEEEFNEMILSQVSINSKIANLKMKHFNRAMLFSIILIPITIILMVIIG